MSKTRVVTDSGSDLSPELCAELGIKVVPLTITFGTEEFKDGVNLSKEAFMQRLGESKQMPFTTQPSPADFAQVYQELKDEGAKEIISVHISSSLSGTFQSSTIGAGHVDGVKVHFVDTRSASLGIGLLVLEAAKLAADGVPAEEIVKQCNNIRDRMGVFFTVDTLEYLAKNGRIGKAQALVGGMLSIKPILTITDDGFVGPFAKVRGKKKAVDTMIEAVSKHVGGKPFIGAVVHAMAETEALALRNRILEEMPGSHIRVELLGPTIGTHVGHGTLGVVAIAP